MQWSLILTSFLTILFLYSQGIYHADMFTKSYDYSEGYGEDFKSRFLFVNEVSLSFF